MPRPSTACLALLLRALLSISSARAQDLTADGPSRARQLNERGNQAMLDMRYVDALALYEKSRALDPSQVGVIYSIARAQQMLGKFPEALGALETFEARATAEQEAVVGQLAQLTTELESRVATLTLRVNQPGARVLVNDSVVGTTPLPPATRLNAGAARVQVELEGFFPEVRHVVLPARGALELEVTLKARSTSALLRMRSQPEHAELFVDGSLVGMSSPEAELVVNAGSHQVRARHDGFEDAFVPVELPAGTTRELAIHLEPTRPVVKRWWFWVTTGVVIAGSAALTAALLIERPAGHGTLPTGQVSAPLTVEF